MQMHKEKDFLTVFNEKTGMYLRTGIMKNGRDTGNDPFMASFPEMLDIGIMGHCIHGNTGLCAESGVQCYQDGLHASLSNMAVEDFENIARQCEGKTYQFALGGCGDPDQHEEFESVLRICKEHHIVANFTTSGLGLTKADARMCKEYCGAVAVSWYRSIYTEKAIEQLLCAGVKTNIHYVLMKSSVEEAVDRLKKSAFPNGINAVIFLLHKPVGLGTAEEILDIHDRKTEEFIKIVLKNDFSFKIGFDSCSVPMLLRYPESIDMKSLDTCEGARWSAYITPDMMMLPCSFDNQKKRWGVSLRTHSIKEAWDSKIFEEFRDVFRNSCPECEKRTFCYGGCPICPEIVNC